MYVTVLWLPGTAEIGVARFDKLAIFRRGRRAASDATAMRSILI